MAASQKKIVLNKPEDWDTWISFLKMKATNLNIWGLIDPQLPVKPEALAKPIEPIFDPGASTASFNKDGYEFYKAQHHLYRPQLARYKKQKEAFVSIISFIQETITAHNVVFIQHVEGHPYDILKALKERLAPTDKARTLQLRVRYDKLRKGPGNQNIEAWVNDWQQWFYEASACKLAEVEGDRAITDFLLAIKTKNPSYAESHLAMLEWNPNTRTMHQFIEAYRQYVRLNASVRDTA